MRIAYSALMTLVVASAVPSVGLAQVLTPFPPHKNQRLDHVVPVATVSLPGEPIALAEAHLVQDPSGEPFVLGAATLDLRDPSHANIVFTMTNATQMPIPWSTVALHVARVTSRPEYGDYFFGCSIDGRAGHQGTWQVGASVTLQLPIAPNANCLKLKESEPQGFLILVKSTNTPGYAGGGKALFTKAFEKLISQAQQ